AIDEAVLVGVDVVEVALDHAARLVLADLAVLVGVETLDDLLDALLEDELGLRVYRLGIDLAVLVSVELAEHVVDFLEVGLTRWLVIAHFDEGADGVSELQVMGRDTPSQLAELAGRFNDQSLIAGLEYVHFHDAPGFIAHPDVLGEAKRLLLPL